MSCLWRNGWHTSRFLYFSPVFWLLLVSALIIMIALLLRGHTREKRQCPQCGGTVEDAYLRCPECGHGLKSHCPRCNRIVETSWQFCPHCRASLQQKAKIHQQET